MFSSSTWETIDLFFGNSVCCWLVGKARFVPFDTTRLGLCSISALRMRFQAVLLVVLGGGGDGLGISDEIIGCGRVGVGI